MAEDNPQTNKQPAVPVQATNCVICNKPLKRLRRYYRAGKFYCSKGCYKRSKAKAKKTDASSES